MPRWRAYSLWKYINFPELITNVDVANVFSNTIWSIPLSNATVTATMTPPSLPRSLMTPSKPCTSDATTLCAPTSGGFLGEFRGQDFVPLDSRDPLPSDPPYNDYEAFNDDNTNFYDPHNEQPGKSDVF
jgi:hypothetical protein